MGGYPILNILVMGEPPALNIFRLSQFTVKTILFSHG